MSKIYVTSDTHFFHENIIKYSNRPWTNIDSMTNGLIENWNAVVKKGDIVYHLGDFAMGGSKRADDLVKVLNKLNGTIRLVKGNHDTYILSEPCSKRFEWIKDYYEFSYKYEDTKKLFVLMHFPLFAWHNANKKGNDGTNSVIHLHGHSHGNIDRLNANTTRMDVGVDSNGYTPVLLDNIIEIMKYRSYTPVDHHV